MHTLPRPLTRALGVVVLLATVVALTAAPASAARQAFPDTLGDTDPRVDLTRVVVTHNAERVKIVVRYADLRPRDKQQHDLGIWIDTDRFRGDHPDHFVGALGNHLVFGETKPRRWGLRAQRKHPFGNVRCATGYRYAPKKNLIRFRFPTRCIGDPRRLRVAVSSGLTAPDGGTVGVDHLVARRHLTAWVRR